MSRKIGTAIGILMSTHRVTEEAAFDMLRACSQRTHRKVRDIAADVVQTGWLDLVSAG
jgi:AmiR/NasT family two-component response regulator